MTQPSHEPDQHPPGEKPERTVEDVMWQRVERRRERIRNEIRRNREGGHKVPTWVLAAVLGALLLGWLYLIVFD
ncbi:hypothetical protein [Couchioplanes azureus]|uniref:hypothetical protein n=1 Tax=Couchioplanes caeruleus TaxID=56438 RepID=UPI00166F6D8A|nr:hypothetical protein [Couchioplanes caeruleus]GGQ63206.1 hypothetical protein GCM10010166_36260 [Couchioplanes caeruleus subsp. azureus]